MSRGSHLPHFKLKPETARDMSTNEVFYNSVTGRTIRIRNQYKAKLKELTEMGFKFAYETGHKRVYYYVDKPDNHRVPDEFWCVQLEGYETYKTYKTINNAIRAAENLVTAVQRDSYRFQDETVEWAKDYVKER